MESQGVGPGGLGARSDTLGRVQRGERPPEPAAPSLAQVGHWGRPRAAGALARSRALWPPRAAAA